MTISLGCVAFVEHDDELLEMVKKALERDGAAIGVLRRFRTVAEASLQLPATIGAPRPDLIVVDEAVPLTSRSAGGSSAEHGRELAKALAREHGGSHVLLFSQQPERPDRLREGGRMLVITVADLLDTAELHSWLDGTLGIEASRTGVGITIEFHIASVQASYRILEANRPPGKVHKLSPFEPEWIRRQIEQYTSERAQVFTRDEMGERLDVNWRYMMDELGRKLYDELILKGPGRPYFDDLLARAGDRHRLHLRFTIEEADLINVPFDSICEPGTGGYFRIKGPVVCKMARDAERNAGNAHPRPADGVLDMVFIESQAEGLLEVHDGDRGVLAQHWFPELKNIGFERALFDSINGKTAQDLRRSSIFDWPFGGMKPTQAGEWQDNASADEFSGKDRVKVTFLRAEPGGRPFRARLGDLLQRADRRPAVVHFAGHSYKAPDGETYLILPGNASGQVDGLKVLTFADWVGRAGASFVYLSSCNGASAQTVSSMVEQGVPQVLGFRWDVEDDRAAEFAFGFYRHLLRERLTFGRAYNEACRSLYQAHPASPIWASPVLVMQGESWWQQSAISREATQEWRASRA